MAKPQYRTPEYVAARKAAAKDVAAGIAVCSEPICKLSSRWIPPGSDWHLSHDPTGAHILGPSHARCNTSEAARRNNPKRARTNVHRWVL